MKHKASTTSIEISSMHACAKIVQFLTCKDKIIFRAKSCGTSYITQMRQFWACATLVVALCLSVLLFFGLMGRVGAWGTFFCFVPLCFNTFARFISAFHPSRNLSARRGDRFSFSVAQDQNLMLVACGDQAPLEHSLVCTKGIRGWVWFDTFYWSLINNLLTLRLTPNQYLIDNWSVNS